MICTNAILKRQDTMKKHTFNKAELENHIAQVLELAKKHGATAAETVVTLGSGFSATVRLGEIDTIEHNNDKGMDITVYIGQKSGSVSTSDLSPKALQMAVEKACNIAQFTEADSYAGLADKALLAFNYPDLDLYHPWNVSEEKGIALALECEKIARAEDKRITNSEGATVQTYDAFYAYGNSNGFIGSFPSSSHTISCAVVANDGHGMQRDYYYTTARDPQTLDDVAVVAKKTAQRTVRRLGAKKISTGNWPVIFAPEMARGLVGSFLSAITGGNLYRQASFLLDHLEQKIFPDYLQIEEKPHLLKGVGSVPFDREGVKTSAKDLVRNGILKTYLLGSYSGRKLKMQSTGNAGGTHNVFVASTGQNFQELLQRMPKGLIITELMGQGVNIVTGDYSRGAFGFWVENGVIQYPVQEITIAGNLKNMFSNIVAVGNDIDHRGNVHTGSILIAEMMVAGS